MIFGLNGGFAKRKRVIFRLSGGFLKKKTPDFHLNEGFVKKKRVIVADGKLPNRNRVSFKLNG